MDLAGDDFEHARDPGSERRMKAATGQEEGSLQSDRGLAFSEESNHELVHAFRCVHLYPMARSGNSLDADIRYPLFEVFSEAQT